MFCPPDYVPLSTLLPRWNEEQREDALRWITADWGDDPTFDGISALAEAKIKYDNDLEWQLGEFFVAAPADQSEQDFFLRIGDNLFMASPDGQVSRLDPGLIDYGIGDFLFTPEDFREAATKLGRTDLLDFSQEPTGLLDSGFLNKFRLTHLTWDQMMADFTAARTSDPKITAWQLARELGSISLHHTVAPFHERIGYKLSLRGYDLAEELGLDCTSLVQELAGQIRPFEGRALCVPQKVAEAMVSARPLKEASQQSRHPPKTAGRPSTKRDKLRDKYLELYPNGHGSLSRGQLLSELLRQTKLKDVSLQTLDRMLREV
ncbi:hypothetical protein [Rubellimicrobium roseum]|uniref:Uncharacterized protein n=1 Tax=Rubellimicrobium roseum TaxID=687525 RepID=A0A5C4N3J4_9RHOB|nr:hypothetical protein [Rubellimicrobium roseum]TNC60469.1 hypothetical protein FHG71_22000 [Rubellimicrobium roseum]